MPLDSKLPKQLVTTKELAEKWSLPLSWIVDHCRVRCADPIPSFRLGRYTRFDLESPELAAWLARRKAVRR
jgi:hypothetical protein